MSGVVGETVRTTVATMPFPISVEFMPTSTQVSLPTAALQVRDLPAEVASLAAATVAAVKSVGEYFRVHWRAAGWVTVALRERFNVTVPPALPEPDDKLSAAVCPKPMRHKATARRERRDHLARAVDRCIIKTPFTFASLRYKTNL